MSISRMENEWVSLKTEETTDGSAAGYIINNEKNEHHFRGDFTMEDSPSYEVLNEHNLLTKKYRVASETELDLLPPNSNRLRNLLSCLMYGPLSTCFLNNFEVSKGGIRRGYDGRGNFVLFGSGVHQVVDPFYHVEHQDIRTYTQTQ